MLRPTGQPNPYSERAARILQHLYILCEQMAGYIVAAWHSTDWALLISRRLVCSAVKFPPHVRIEVATGRLGFDQRRDRLIWHVAVVVPRAPEPDQQVPVLVVVAHSSNEAAFDGGAFEGIEAQGPSLAQNRGLTTTHGAPYRCSRLACRRCRAK